MLAFLRRVRHQLLAQNRITRYLLYAIGEIILVVIGILIAVTINDYNSARKDRENERLYITSLLRDLRNDVRELEEVEAFDRRLLLGLDTLRGFSQADLQDPEKADSVHLLFRRYCSSIETYYNNDRTLNQLESTGDFNILAPEVLDSVAVFREQVEFVKGQEQVYYNALMKVIDTGSRTLHVILTRDTRYIDHDGPTGRHFPPIPDDPSLQMELFNRIAFYRGSANVYLNSRIIPHKARTVRLIAFLEEFYELEKVSQTE